MTPLWPHMMPLCLLLAEFPYDCKSKLKMSDGRLAEGHWRPREVSEPMANQTKRREPVLVEKSEAVDEQGQAGLESWTVQGESEAGKKTARNCPSWNQQSPSPPASSFSDKVVIIGDLILTTLPTVGFTSLFGHCLSATPDKSPLASPSASSTSVSVQGGPVFDIFSGQGKDPVAKWKLSGGPSAIYKEYNKEVKGFVYCLEGSSQTVKMQMPENGKMSLGLIQRYLVLQVNVPQSYDFSTELLITDSEHLKRRLHLSTVHKELSTTLLHAKIPFVGLKRNAWSTLCIDLVSLACGLFKGFLTLEGITLFATCKVRRIFTMKGEPVETSNEVSHSQINQLSEDQAPRHFTHSLRLQSFRTVSPNCKQKKCNFMQNGEKCTIYTPYCNLMNPNKTKCTPAKQSPGVAPTPAKSHLCLIRPDLSSDLRVRNSWEGNKRFEPQLTLQEEAFTFSSKPHSPKRGRGQDDQEMMETRHDLQQSRNGRRHHPQPKDDFIGSESDEDKSYPVFHHKKCGLSCPATPTTTETTQHEQLESHSESSIMNQTSSKQLRLPSTSMQFPSIRRAGPAGLVPTRCLSPNGQSHKSEKGIQPLGGNSSVSVSRKLLQEIRLDDSKHHKEQEYEALKTVDSSHYLLRPHRSLRMDTCDDEELQMLASLRKEQEEDECSSLALSTSQIHQCAVSISMSSDDTSTWTHMSTPMNQGHHYQKEMNPLLLQSNPREWMDVLSPPIMPPSQQRRSGNTQNNLESRGRGT
ncbi:unnamed protein product, partial [Menidia menidia]